MSDDSEYQHDSSGFDVGTFDGDGNHDFGHGAYTGDHLGEALHGKHSLADSVAVARRVNKGVRADIVEHPTRKAHLDSHSRLLSWAVNLDDPKRAPKALAEIKEKFSAQKQEASIAALKAKFPTQEFTANAEHVFPANGTVDQARAFIQPHLDAQTNELHQIRNGPKRVAVHTHQGAAVTAREPTTFVRDATEAPRLDYTHAAAKARGHEIPHRQEKGPGFFSRGLRGMFDWHQSKLATYGEGTRLGIAFGEMTVGSILAEVGGRWLVQAFNGTEQKQINTVDDHNNPTTITVTEAISPNTRVLKGVLGGVTTAAGVAGTGLGIYNLIRPM